MITKQPRPELIAALATVPEHSLPLMTALSEGEPLLCDNYLFYHGQDWLSAIGYPLAADFNLSAFSSAIQTAINLTGASRIYAIGCALPEEFKAGILETDRFYVLSANAPIPGRLKSGIRQARQKLEARESASFTPSHRRLWAEFLQRNGAAMTGRVAELYARTPQALEHPSIKLLDACDKNGHLAASLLLDYTADNFVSYILGAHSRAFYVPYATDLLFAEMLALARERKKRFIHLGLGVNEGILRFKKKWGAIPSWPFYMAVRENAAEEPVSRVVMRAIRHAGSQSARQFLQNEPQQRPFAMLWQVEKEGRVSWLAGTAHFFLYSFEASFRDLFRKVDTVIFEGSLDQEFLRRVNEAGKAPIPAEPMLAQLSEAEILALERVVHGPQGKLAKIMGAQKPARVDVRWLLGHGMPWYAFFTLWTTYLERLGWNQSVDMEAWRLAQAMSLRVIAMETLEEQLESLASLPVSRALNFFRSCKTWKRRARANLSAYLAGDLEKMMGSSAEFPTRTEHIIGKRDQRFRERMRPWLEKGNCAVFVGAAHVVNLRHMLAEDGFRVTQLPHGLWGRLNLRWRKILRPDEQVTW